jgi:hypothetical protein
VYLEDLLRAAIAKDREITLVQIDTTLDAVRAHRTSKLLVIAEHGKETHSKNTIDARIGHRRA